MARINWMMIATWAALLVSLLIAFLFGWYQWGRLTIASENKKQVNRNIAIQERNTEQLRSQLKDVTKQIAAPNTPREDPEFFMQLKYLIESSGVKQVNITPTAPALLPTIGSTKPPPGGSADAKKEDPNKTGYSLANLPLGVRALSTNVTVVGPFQNINAFVRRIYNYRFSGGGVRYGAPRAININSLQIGGLNTQGQLRATLMLTRFVSRPEAETPAKTSATPPAPAPTNATSATR